jgi:hypothetical protein
MESGITLNDYERSPCAKNTMNETTAIAFHHFFLTNCVVKITQSNEYMVRMEHRKTKSWIPKSKEQLTRILDRNTQFIYVTVKGKETKKKVKYSDYLEHPVISQSMLSFTGREFTTTKENPDCFPSWTGHRFPEVEVVNMELIQPFLDHVKNIICSGDEKVYEIEMAKNAWMFQNPDKHLGWATVLIGGQGTGKNCYTNVLLHLWGDLWSTGGVKISQVCGDKCVKIVHNKKLIVCDELPKWKSNDANEQQWETLKSRITDDTFKGREMYQDYSDYELRNVSNYMMTTNNFDGLAPLCDKDRRFFILGVSSEKQQDREYFQKLIKLTEKDETLQHLLTYLLRLPIPEHFDPWIPPMTPLKLTMMEDFEALNIRYIKLKRWREIPPRPKSDLEYVPFRAIWDDYKRWLSDVIQVNPDKYHDNKFTQPLIEGGWVEKRKTHPSQLRPTQQLRDYWTRLEEENRRAEEEDEREREIEMNLV